LLGFVLLGFADPLGRLIANTFALNPSLALTNSLVLTLMFISRIIDGLTGGNLTVAQAYISDVTDAQNRARGLGLIGAAFGLGFILGPAAGGLLSQWGYAAPAFAAAALAGLNLLSVAFRLPESLTLEDRQALAKRPRPPVTARALFEALNRPRVGPLLHIRFFYGLAFATFQSIFPLYAAIKLSLNAAQTGLVLTYVGVLAAVVQGVLVGRLAKSFPEAALIFYGSIVFAASMLAWALTPNLWVILIIMAPLSFAGGVLNTILNSSLTKSVYPEEIGGTLGLSASVESLTRVIAPTAGGFLLGQLGAWAPAVFSSLLMVWTVTFAYRRIIQCPDPPLPSRLSPHPAD
jgi:DHA1 family tetracycline resistance protein-like MFS transporter